LQQEDLKNVDYDQGDSYYLAAEVLRGPPTRAADIFSLGVSALELVTDVVLPKNKHYWHELVSHSFLIFVLKNL
jgi:mitosis inhibitor protein kinase SWE1